MLEEIDRKEKERALLKEMTPAERRARGDRLKKDKVRPFSFRTCKGRSKSSRFSPGKAATPSRLKRRSKSLSASKICLSEEKRTQDDLSMSSRNGSERYSEDEHLEDERRAPNPVAERREKALAHLQDREYGIDRTNRLQS